MTATEAANLTELMRDVVVEGTGSSVRTDAYTVAAKTGTAEFETGKETHAWFTGFAPAESPKIVVTVLVEESGKRWKNRKDLLQDVDLIYYGEISFKKNNVFYGKTGRFRVIICLFCFEFY